jgi:hypothetical protein
VLEMEEKVEEVVGDDHRKREEKEVVGGDHRKREEVVVVDRERENWKR